MNATYGHQYRHSQTHTHPSPSSSAPSSTSYHRYRCMLLFILSEETRRLACFVPMHVLPMIKMMSYTKMKRKSPLQPLPDSRQAAEEKRERGKKIIEFMPTRYIIIYASVQFKWNIFFLSVSLSLFFLCYSNRFAYISLVFHCFLNVFQV